MDSKELIMLITTDPRKDPEKCSIALSIATSALASDMHVKMFFASEGINMIKKGYLDDISVSHFEPLASLLSLYVEAGGELIMCQPSMLSRGVTEEELVGPVVMAAAPSLIGSLTDAKIISL